MFIGSRKIVQRWDCVMAAITATGGGVIRDMLVREIPVILKSDFYVSAALIGSACFVITGMLEWSEDMQLFCAITVTIILRIFRYEIWDCPANGKKFTGIAIPARKRVQDQSNYE